VAATGAAVIGLASGLAACGGGSSSSSSSSSTTTSTTNTTRTTASSATTGGGATTITIQNFAYRPATITVKAGSTITVKNQGTTTHALEIVLKSGEIKTKPISPGQSVQVKVPAKAGSYDMYCPIDQHKQKGMTGKLTVGGSGGAGSGTSTENTNTGTTGTSGTTTYSTGY